MRLYGQICKLCDQYAILHVATIHLLVVFFCPLHIYLHVFCKTLQFAFDNLIRHVCASLNKAASEKKKIVIWRKFIDISGEVTIYMQSFIFKIFHLKMMQKLSFYNIARCYFCRENYR